MILSTFVVGASMFTYSVVGIIRLKRNDPGRKIIKCLVDAGVIKKVKDKIYPPRITHVDHREYGVRYYLGLPGGFGSKDVINKQQLLAEALRTDVFVGYSHNEGVYVDVLFDEMPSLVSYRVDLEPEHFSVPIGIDRKGSIVSFNLEGDFPHLLVGGMSGTGKSVFLRSFLTTVARYNMADLYLCDLKGGVELSLFEELTITKGFATDLNALKTMLQTVHKEMERRYAVIKKMGSQEWIGTKIIVVIDEMIDLRTSPNMDKEERKIRQHIKTLLSSISAKGRAASIHMVLCTQRPDASVVDGIIKTNICSTLAFRTRDDTQSAILLDNNKSSQLPNVKGRAIFQQDTDIEIQTYFLDHDKAKYILSKLDRKDGLNDLHSENEENAKEKINPLPPEDPGLPDSGTDTDFDPFK